jgi:hypothetical protein
LQSALPTIQKNVSINGSGFSTLDVQGNGNVYLNEAAGGAGGAVYNASGASVTLNNTDVAVNTAGAFGGGIANFGNLGCNATDIYSNNAENGGAIANLQSAATAEIPQNTQIYSNSASELGGGVYNTGGSFFMSGFSGGYIKGNDAKYGGGIYVGSGTLTLKLFLDVYNNQASISGGGLYMAGGKVTISGGSIYSNTATNNGGGIYNGGGTLTLSGGEMIGPSNSAVDGGGVYLTAKSTTNFTSVTVSGNKATGLGVGVAYEKGATMNQDGLTDKDGANGPVMV